MVAISACPSSICTTRKSAPWLSKCVANACLSTCELASCGDGFVHTGVELCDDGNLADGDGCPSGCQPPASCEEHSDLGSGSVWVVCAADTTSAWVSGTEDGWYHPALICQMLGYSIVYASADNCGTTCGSCSDGFDCSEPGSIDSLPWYDWSGGNCGSDALGEVLCGNVTWICG